ncbi:MAG: hypothetical protein RL113_1054 [Pseudomonadota bacterium]
MNEYNLVGKSYTFEDGNSITVVQIKERDGNEKYVTYHVKTGPGIPRKLVLKNKKLLLVFLKITITSLIIQS